MAARLPIVLILCTGNSCRSRRVRDELDKAMKTWEPQVEARLR